MAGTGGRVEMRRRRGPIIGATWLIGLGVVFLVQRSTGWTWSQAWPMFVILIGVASLVGATFDARGGAAQRIWGLTWPVAWTAVGVLLLASTTGSLATGPAELVDTYWPWAVILLGIWFLIGAFVPGRPPLEQLALPLDGAERADVRIRFGAGELTMHRAPAGSLIDGTFQGGVRHRLSSPGRLELEQDLEGGVPWLDHQARWEVGLTGEVPLDLRLDTGASRSRIDLGDMRVASLDLHTGASETRVRLPRSAGATSVRAQAGAAALIIEVPVGVAARIHSRMALGTTEVDEARFPRVGDAYQSVDYATATDRVDIEAQGGVGSIRVVSAT